ncbi:MAG: hypothetical protein E5X33_10910 [Mesorhizobium sp.]|uniref:hypothetical protein n=1 Tax=Mesorhizobium sp. TaxID=1871066 RepID=UPI000FEA9607|nr:hypothetical protein [Mesorhizobium sp.]RWI95469.1 MAG: hypothetical protein EOR22_09065 [Mesorhizobium sp.]TIR21590.1 MAG: hypothetical protein E5X33_10910 [Mesorhizobium sp.]
MADDLYLQAYRKAGGRKRRFGLKAVNELVEHLPSDDRIRALNSLADSGLWEIQWRYIAREGKKQKVGGFVKAYLGDEED